MARALPNTNFQSSYLDDIALDSLGRDAARRYLRSQLRELDAQIETLTHAQIQESWQILERAAWSQKGAAKIVWAGRLELYYLHAVREALVETLTRL
ncbi:MAG: hypothetical protein ACE5LU_03725 [Anaerolineae bacterium]